MDSNECDTNHLDARLPPRKRLLAGLKKQSFSESTSQCSQENNPSPSLSPSIVQSPLSEFDVRLSNLLKSYKNGSNMSPEEIALAAKSAAEAAAKAAEVARAVAEEKAAIAAKAVAAAKSALDLVPHEETSRRDKHPKKKKLKNHMPPVQLLDEEYQSTENCGADEELARRLHRSMNSSPRIVKPSSGSSSRNHKHKKLKMYSPNEKSGVSNGDAADGMEYEGSIEEAIKVNEKESESSKNNEGDVDSSEAESIHPKEKTVEGISDLSISGRKRGRIRRKKLPLSICSTKDQENSKEESKSSNPLLTRARTEKSAAHQLALLSMEPSADNVTQMEIEAAPTWKCQDFKVSQCIKQDKLVES